MKKLYTTLVAFLAIANISFAQTTTYRDDAGLKYGGASGFFETYNPVNYPGTGGFWHLLDVRHTNNVNNYAMQFSGSFYDQVLYFRKTADNGSQPWSRVILESNGLTGVGTTSPNTRLHVYSGTENAVLTALRLQGGEGSSSGSSLLFSSSYTAVDYQTARISGLTTGWGTDFKSDLAFSTNIGNQGNALTEKMRITGAGNVGIGTTNPDSKLTVKGKIHAEEVKIDNQIPVPDYVFNKDYPLMSLTDVKNYIDKNHHLPEVPSAADVEMNGLNLGEMNLTLLKKVEELTLHLIEKDQQLKDQQLQLTEVKQALKDIKASLKKN
jgi:hypothetical protein